MINFVLEQLSERYINDKGKRTLLLTSLYLLIMHTRGKDTDLEKLNQELNLVHDLKGVNLATLIYPIIWPERFKYFVDKAPLDKIIRYVVLKLPRWLDYRGSSEFSMEKDLNILKSFLAKA